MGFFESLVHMEEIEQLNQESNQLYSEAMTRFNQEKEKATKCLETLGKTKLTGYKQMEKFVEEFGSFKNIDMAGLEGFPYEMIEWARDPEQMFPAIRNSLEDMSDLMKINAISVGTGALVGLAAYGGVAMFGSTPSGVKISSLSGKDQQDAVLKWWGNGSQANGALMIGGIAVVSVLAVGTLLSAAKSGERLAEARAKNAEAKEAAAKMHLMATTLEEIGLMANNYTEFLNKFSKTFEPFVGELKRIRRLYTPKRGEKVDFASLSLSERKALHLAWLLAQIYYECLKTPVMTEKGKTNKYAGTVLIKAKDADTNIRKDIQKASVEDICISNILWKKPARSILLVGLAQSGFFLYLGTHNYMQYGFLLQELVCLASAVVSFPVFFFFKNLSAQKKFYGRFIRVILGSILFATMYTVH